MNVKKESNDSILLIAQSEMDQHLLHQLATGCLAVRCDHMGQMRVRIIPDMAALVAPKTSEYEGKSVDDLVTEAVQLGLPVKKNTLRDDVIKILETFKTDPERATRMAESARPAQAVNQFKSITPGVNDGVHAARTMNNVSAQDFEKIAW